MTVEATLGARDLLVGSSMPDGGLRMADVALATLDGRGMVLGGGMADDAVVDGRRMVAGAPPAGMEEDEAVREGVEGVGIPLGRGPFEGDVRDVADAVRDMDGPATDDGRLADVFAW
jgi:hypothetical protein